MRIIFDVLCVTAMIAAMLFIIFFGICLIGAIIKKIEELFDLNNEEKKEKRAKKGAKR